MKEIRVEDAVGEVLCHDITEIVKDGVKGARFRKGHIICAEDIPVLHRLGKAHIFIFAASRRTNSWNARKYGRGK